MKSFLVESPGLLTTVQDLGRPGFGAIGVSPSGAADPVSLRLGNRLVGNEEAAAALEMTLHGGGFRFLDDAVAALAGSDFGATLDGAAIDTGVSFAIRAGQTLGTGATRSGARCYLCVQGGIVVPKFLGSASTHMLSGLGGFEGRALRKADVLRIGDARGPFHPRHLAPDLMQRLSERTVLRVTPGPQAEWFSDEALAAFHGGAYRVGEQSNRMGLRLEGAPVMMHRLRAMMTEGVSLGAIQIPPGGSPIILFVEQQTTGGYPKIANIIAADLHRVGQLRPRDEIRFEPVTFEAAQALLIEQARLLASPEIILE
jgi:antagonist of KipI